MSEDAKPRNLIEVEPLTADSFRPYGWLLGKAIRLDGSIPAFRNAETEFWEEHLFDPGVGGETQVLWVIYRNRRREVASLEVHRLTQQAVIPLTGEIMQVVAVSGEDGAPDMRSLRAFLVPVGEGICMRPGCWHATRVECEDVKCMMLTRRSTTGDLVAYLTGGSLLCESAVAVVRASLRV
jgi:ureidoglycolate lyase